MELERELDTLYETLEASRCTCPHLKGMLNFSPQLKKSSVFPSSSRDEGQFPCFIWEGMQRLRCPSRGGWSQLDKGEEPGSLPQFERHGYPHPLEIKSDSIAQIWMEPRESTHNMKGGLIPWLQIREKPQVPNSTRLEAWNLFYSSRGKQSSMPKHKLRPDSLFETADTPRDPRQNRRGTLSLLPQLEMRPCSIAPPQRNPERPLTTLKDSWLPIGTMRSSLRSPSQLEGIQSFLPQLEKDLEIPTSMQIEAWFPCSDLRAIPSSPSQLELILDFLEQHRRLPEFPVLTREKSDFPPQLEKNHEFPPSSLDGALLFLQGLESNPEFPLKTP